MQYSCFQASAAMQMTSALFWDITQRRYILCYIYYILMISSLISSMQSWFLPCILIIWSFMLVPCTTDYPRSYVCRFVFACGMVIFPLHFEYLTAKKYRVWPHSRIWDAHCSSLVRFWHSCHTRSFFWYVCVAAVAYRGGLGYSNPPEIPKISVESSIAWARRTGVSISCCTRSSLCSRTVVIYLIKVSFNTNCLVVAYLVSEFKCTPASRKFDKVKPDCKLGGKRLVFLFQHPN